MFDVGTVPIGASSLFTPPDEHALLIFWAQFVVLLVAARAFGRLMRRMGQPPVIGELGAGLVLGPSVFGALWPSGFEWLFPAGDVQSAMLFTVGWIGVAFLLVVTGFETDLGLIRSLGRAAVFVAAGSLAVPFLLGVVTGMVMPASFVGERGGGMVFALFIGTALSISSLPVIAKVLAELNLMRRNFGQVTLAAGMANDLIGWMALGLIAGLAQSGTLSGADLLVTLLGMALFLVAALTLGQRLVDGLLRSLRSRSTGVGGGLSVIVTVALAAGVITQAIGVEAVLGAFVAGIVIGRSRFQQDDVRHHLEAVTNGVFAPVFFATAGLRVDLSVLGRADVAFWGGAVLLVASVSKFVGALGGARLAGLSRREGAALGVGLNARGALEIVIATVGIGLGVLNQASYTVVVLMAMATSMMAPPMLRAVVSNWSGTPEEQRRLEEEERLGSNVVVRPSRLLLPSRGGPSSLAAARLAHLVWPVDVPVTVLSIAGSSQPAGPLVRVLDTFGDRPTEHSSIDVDDVGEGLTAEALLGYGAMVVGADRSRPGTAVSPLVDRVVATCPIPVVVVRTAHGDGAARTRYRRIVVPVTGTRYSRAAQEVALGAAQKSGAEVVFVHVMTTSPTPELVLSGAGGAGPGASSGSASPGGREAATSFLAEASRQAEALGVACTRVVLEGGTPGDEIVTVAAEQGADLVVVGANVRTVEGRPFLGHNVERVLDEADMTVAVVALPPEEGSLQS